MRVASILVVMGALSGCVHVETDVPDRADPGDAVAWRAELTGKGAWHALAGHANLQLVDGSATFMVGAEIRNDAPGSVRPWHLHAGSCANGGGMIGIDDEYPALLIADDGTDWVMVLVPEQLVADGTYHIDVHLSARESDVIACGDLLR